MYINPVLLVFCAIFSVIFLVGGIRSQSWPSIFAALVFMATFFIYLRLYFKVFRKQIQVDKEERAKKKQQD